MMLLPLIYPAASHLTHARFDVYYLSWWAGFPPRSSRYTLVHLNTHTQTYSYQHANLSLIHGCVASLMVH